MTTERIPNPTPDGDHYRIIRGSMGGFLCPPGYPNHSYEVRGARSPRTLMSNPNSITSLDHAASEEAAQYLPTSIVEQARRLLTEADMVCSELWVQYVYSYMVNSYSPDGVRRDVASFVRTGPPEHHGAYLMVKSFFPDHEPRLDLIETNPHGYGSRECAKCGTTLQYEAKVDAYAEPITALLACHGGRNHQPTD